MSLSSLRSAQREGADDDEYAVALAREGKRTAAHDHAISLGIDKSRLVERLLGVVDLAYRLTCAHMPAEVIEGFKNAADRGHDLILALGRADDLWLLDRQGGFALQDTVQAQDVVDTCLSGA